MDTLDFDLRDSHDVPLLPLDAQAKLKAAGAVISRVNLLRREDPVRGTMLVPQTTIRHFFNAKNAEVGYYCAVNHRVRVYDEPQPWDPRKFWDMRVYPA